MLEVIQTVSVMHDSEYTFENGAAWVRFTVKDGAKLL